MNKLMLKHVRVRLGRQDILPDLSLDVADGEFLSLLGPSGCGKSTLLKAIAGIVPIEDGEIYLRQSEISKLPPHRRNTVIVFQDMRLFPNMSAAENVAYPLRVRKVPAAEKRRIADELLENVQLSGYGDRRIFELSGGQQQRIALARALAAKPDVLLLDEPFSALDENLREGMRKLVKDLHHKFKMTTILVTHDRQEAMTMADRAAVMMDGEILQCDTPLEIYRHPANSRVADFFKDCVYLSGDVRQGVFSATEQVEIPLEIKDGHYELMLKTGAIPEALQSKTENLSQSHEESTTSDASTAE